MARAATSRFDVDLLCLGESDLRSPDTAIDSLKAALDEAQNTRYCDLRGLFDLRWTIAAYLSRLHQNRVGEPRVQVTASGTAAINVAYSAIARPGDKVVVHAPAWPNAGNLARLRGGVIEEIALENKQGKFRLDLDRLDRALRGARVFLLNSPNNPTGWTATREELRGILELCRRHGAWIISDEVYSRIFYQDKPAAPSLLDVADAQDKVIVCNSFSKSWAMSGWRLGWMVVPAGERDHITEIVELTHSAVASFSQIGALAALQDDAFIERVRDYCARGRRIVAEELDRVDGVEFNQPDGAFFAFLKIDGLSNSLDLALWLIEHHGVAVAPGSAFGATGEGYLRLCFAKSAEQLRRSMSRLRKGLAARSRLRGAGQRPARAAGGRTYRTAGG